MAHYAFLDENNVVTAVIPGRHEWESVKGVNDWEAHYGEFYGCRCLRTSFNTKGNQHLYGGTPFRGNYAVVDGIYDEERDAFIDPQPYPSWVLNDETLLWEAPTPRPDDGTLYVWDEDAGQWQVWTPEP